MMGVVALLGLSMSLQVSTQAVSNGEVQQSAAPARSVPAPTDSTAVAVRTDAPPVIDGKDDDPAWATAPAITGFKQWRPTEGKEPRFRTSAKVLYDAANLY